MNAERDLQKLISGMSPVLDPARYVFATTPDPEKHATLNAIMRFKEDEGETLILRKADAVAARIEHLGDFARITLSVTSALDAVGFLAAVCSALADAGISTNAVAAYHHDHIFVPFGRAEEAMQVLQYLSEAS